MLEAQFYFLSDRYYQDFPDKMLMRNKEVLDGSSYKRPCFFAFPDSKILDIYWIVPVSSQYEKYKKIEQTKIKKYGQCETIRFGTLLGRNTAFLIQNMCPSTQEYLTPYIDKNNCPIRISSAVSTDVIKNAHIVLAMARRGAKVIFPDVFKIYQTLEQQLLIQSQTNSKLRDSHIKNRDLER